MEELLEKIVRPLLTHKDKLEIKEVIRDSLRSESSRPGRTYDLIVSSEDMGKVIGSKGNIIKSIRTVAKAMARPGERITINVREPEQLEDESEDAIAHSFSSEDEVF